MFCPLCVPFFLILDMILLGCKNKYIKNIESSYHCGSCFFVARNYMVTKSPLGQKTNVSIRKYLRSEILKECHPGKGHGLSSSKQSAEVQPLSELRGRAFIRSRADALPS